MSFIFFPVNLFSLEEGRGEEKKSKAYHMQNEYLYSYSYFFTDCSK